MFDHAGREVAPSLSFLRTSQAWYRKMLLAAVAPTERAQFQSIERGLAAGLALDPQAQLVLNARLLEWLLDHAPVAQADRLRGKFKLMQQDLRFQLEETAGSNSRAARRPYQLPNALQHRLLTYPALKALPPRLQPQFVTGESGVAYRQLCSDHGVPLPPDFGPTSLWLPRAVSGNPDGIIEGNDLFIVRGMRAQVLTYTSTSPAGLCVALPRFDASDTVSLDGVICLGQSDPLDAGGRAKACFWDNQTATGAGFTFLRGTSQAISQWAGGAGLVGGSGGVCTDCHAGENPFIVHGPVLGSLGAMASSPNWHEPIVGGTWPQNPGPMNSPPSCTACHGSAGAGGFAGRLPHLSTTLGGYCNAVLRSALGANLLPPITVGGMPNPERMRPNPPSSMPIGAPGSLACTPNLPATDPRYRACAAGLTASCSPGLATSDPGYIACTPEAGALLAWCGAAASGDASTRGDPHVTTFDGTPYDFQGAGEFIYLRNGSNVEVQVRQSAVATAAPVGPDAHTGLTTCPSINTAMAARIGRSRITYQPAPQGRGEPTPLELRIDGKLVRLPSGSINVGGGRVTRSAIGGGIEIDFPDNTHLSAVPGFWGPPNNVWFLNVDVTGATAREGVAGAILSGQWLPLLPDGTPLGPKPASLSRRHFDLNKTFANAWRVTPSNSLFDYAAGTSTGTFTTLGWPPEKPPCEIKGSKIPPAQPMDVERAEKFCAVVADKDTNAQCVFDVSATGNVSFVDTYLITQQLRKKNAAAKKLVSQSAKGR